MKDNIPTYQELMGPVLEAAKCGARKISDVVGELSDQLNLSNEDREILLPSGKQTVIANRIHWARSYLKQAGLLSNPRRGWFELTERGTRALERGDKITPEYLEQFPEYQEFKSRTNQTGDQVQTIAVPVDGLETPDEDIQAAHQRLNRILASEILRSLRQGSPSFFEQVIVDLFVAMGYGGSNELAGRAVGRSGDRGVDGVIDQDPLGVDQIYLQAKRYDAANSVSSSEIRDFFGALNLRKATKGIFVTTSDFSSSARQTVRDLGSRIVLIDGKQLAELMISYGVGVRLRDTLNIMEFDEGYFGEA